MGPIGTGHDKDARDLAHHRSASRQQVRLAVFQGELDATSHEELARTLDELLETPEPIIVDLSGSRFCSASCIELIAQRAQHAQAMRIDFSVMAPRFMARCFELHEPAPRVIPGHRPLSAGAERKFVHIYTV
ncbi:STAS domain-containing protein [Lolliginicoccus suaedae]|uniref:STAS domain-containing protein n=1 Tax=Lolliginicoccus suaedae TaxID=2605429 RepID=UPI0011ECED05|nr:STAS domain-containing protein [Lolliginicoccus suaedae]